jgi:peptide/nickel transport system substrate-binding protein
MVGRTPASPKVLILALLGIALFLALACGGAATPAPTAAPAAADTPTPAAQATTAPAPDATDTPAPMAEPTATQAPVAQPTPTQAPATAPTVSRALTFVSVDQPNHIDWTNGNPGGTTEFFRDNFNDTLTWKPLGSSEIVPRLAESWEQVAPDEWVWKLRQDVTYHNGEKWNAPAAAHNLNLTYITERNHGLPTYLGYYEVQWTADDKYTLRQKCPEACVISPLAHTFSEIWQAPELYDSLSEQDRARQFSGNGPFKLVSWTPGVSIEVEAFEDYWQGAPQNIPAATIVWRLEELVRAAMIQAGEADLAVSIGTDNLESVPKSVTGGSSEVFMIMLNQRGQVPALMDARVRQALRHAVDCEAMVNAFYSGKAKCTGAIFNENAIGNRPDIAKQYEYNPEKARQLLEEADYTNKYADTTDLAIFTRQGRVPHDVEVMESMAAYWNDIGVTAHVEVVESSVWDAKFRSFKAGTEDADVVVTPHGNEIGDGARSLRYINCESPSSSVCDPETQALVDAALAADAATREEKIYQAFKQAYEQAQLMSLFETAIAYGMVENLEFTPRDDRRIRFTDQITWLE